MVQHGQRLPLCTDTRSAEFLAERIAKKLSGAVLLPALPFGTAQDTSAWPGTVSIRNYIYQEVIEDILESFIIHGFTKFLVVNFHGPNHQPIEKAIEMIQLDYDVQILNPDKDVFMNPEFMKLCESLFGKKLAHGNEVETSISVAIEPDLIRPAEAVTGTGPDYFPLKEEMPATPTEWRRLIPLGHFGNPAKAKLKAGQILINWIIN